MSTLICISCKRYFQLSKYRGVIKDRYNWNLYNFVVRHARTNFRKPRAENILPSGDNGEVFEKSTTNAPRTSAEFTPKSKDQEPFSANQSAVDSDSESLPPYVKLQDNDTTMSKTMVAVQSKKNKINRTEILLEGTRLISEAVRHSILPKAVFFSRVEDIKKISWPAADFKMYKVPYRTIKIWSTLTTSPGVIGIFEVPDIDAKEAGVNSMPLVIVCDNIRDPGNLGSILRVVAGVGCQCVLLTKGCVDLWDAKVLRSGAGAHFVLPVRQDCTWEKIREYMDDKSPIILADSWSSPSDGSRYPGVKLFQNNLPLHQYHLVDYSGAWETNSPTLLVLGGETEGLSKEACELAESRGGIRLHIPLHNEVESLNAATALGVITFEIRRQYGEWIKKTKQSSLQDEKQFG